MKINLNLSTGTKRSGFTLIEMIGVLAVIAILAAVLIPKVFEAINNSRINNTAMSCNTIKTGVIDHYAKFGTLVQGKTIANPQDLTAAEMRQYDAILLLEQLIDKPFAPKIGDQTLAADATRIEVVAAVANDVGPTASGAAPTVTGDAAYNLDNAGTVNDATGSYVVQAVISGVAYEDAKALDRIIDGTQLSSSGPTDVTDLRGRVKWAQKGTTGLATVYVYLTHR